MNAENLAEESSERSGARVGVPPSAELGARTFPTTLWTMVLDAGGEPSEEAARALEALCRTYWYPLYAFVRRMGYSHADAQDLTQGFFAYVLEKHSLARADRERGRFRSFLLGSLKHFLANERDKALTQKRGGDRGLVSLDDAEAEAAYEREGADELTPEQSFDRRWALALIERAKDRVQREYAAAGKAALFEALQGYLGRKEGEPVAATAARLGLSVAAAKSAIHRLRQQYYAWVRDAITQTVSSPAEVDGEIRYLLTMLRE